MTDSNAPSRVGFASRVPINELCWLAPFVCLGLIALAPARPGPVFPPPVHSRAVTDAEGTKVAIPQPFRASVGFGGVGFLGTTHAPEALFKAGGPRDRSHWFAGGLMSRIYPQVLNDKELWNCSYDLESLLAQDNGATYLDGPVDALRRIGLTALSLGWRPENEDRSIFTVIHVEQAAMGREQRAETLIADYRQAFAALDHELQPGTLATMPRVLEMGSSARDWTSLRVMGVEATRYELQRRRIGVENASEGYEDAGRQQEAERILSMNPAIVFVFGENVRDFRRDPRWQSLYAVRSNRVYNALHSLRGNDEPLNGLDIAPLWARWMAEIAHPVRLQPKMREVLYDHFAKAYGYHLSDDEIDDLLRVEENNDSAGYARFIKKNHTGHRHTAER